MGARRVVVVARLTKIHEEFLRGTRRGNARAARRPAGGAGEITLLIGKAGGSRTSTMMRRSEDAVRALEQQGLSRMDAIKQVAKERGIPEARVYRRLMP